MALDIDDVKKMVSEILCQIDYDIWKEQESFVEDQPDEWNLYDDLIGIVEKYVKVNP